MAISCATFVSSGVRKYLTKLKPILLLYLQNSHRLLTSDSKCSVANRPLLMNNALYEQCICQFRTSAALAVKKQSFYEILGVPLSADQQEIKNAFYQLAKRYHPDVNNNDPNAQKKFQEVSEAYEVLGDETRRQKYDTSRGNSNYRSNFSGFQSNINPEEIFRKIFGQDGFKISGFNDFDDFTDADYGFAGASEIVLNLKFEESARGCSKPIEVSVDDVCSRCDGNKAEPGTKKARCHHCHGTGNETISTSSIKMKSRCRHCRGARVLIKTPCVECHGRGKTLKRKQVTVEVPAGVEDGQTLRVSMGNREIFITLKVAKSKLFRRHGADIHSDVSISLSQAVLGGTIRIPGLYEDILHTISAGTASHTRVRLQGMGFTRAHCHGRGDQYLHIKVCIPSALTSQQKALMLTFAESEGNGNGAVAGITVTPEGNKMSTQEVELVNQFRKVFDSEKQIANRKQRDSQNSN